MRIEPQWGAEEPRFGMPPGASSWTQRHRKWTYFCAGLCAILFFSLGMSALRHRTPTAYQLNHISLLSRDLPDTVLNRLTLSRDECDTLFPDNAFAAERTRSWYAARQGVTRAAVDEAAQDTNARIVIRNGRLYIDKYRFGYQSRVMAVIQSLYAAIITAQEPIPDVEFSFAVGDFGNGKQASWELTYHKDSEPATWLLLDFGFFGWPESRNGAFGEFRQQAEERRKAVPWRSKMPDLFWRGAPMVELRKQLIELSADLPYANVSEVDWWNSEKGPIISLPETCEHKYLVGTEGNSYSGRLKFLLHCNSVVVSHKREWIQHFHHLLDYRDSSPTQNIVYVPGPGWTGLEATMKDLMADDSRAHRIADNAHSLFARRYLSPAAGACYWRSALHAYASVQRFEPEIRDAKPYAEFILTNNPYG